MEFGGWMFAIVRAATFLDRDVSSIGGKKNHYYCDALIPLITTGIVPLMREMESTEWVCAV